MELGIIAVFKGKSKVIFNVKASSFSQALGNGLLIFRESLSPDDNFPFSKLHLLNDGKHLMFNVLRG